MLCFITSHQVLWAWIWGCTRITRGQSRGILSALQGRPWTSLCAPVRVVASLSPDSLGTLTRPGRFGTPWQPLPSGVWATGVPGRCVGVCVCVVGRCLGRASGVARVGPLHCLGARNTLERAPGPAASHGGPGCAGIFFANIYVCYFLCLCVWKGTCLQF